jgi:hypothetical protein
VSGSEVTGGVAQPLPVPLLPSHQEVMVPCLPQAQRQQSQATMDRTL